MALGRPHSVWRKMARATRSGVGAGSSRVTAESTAAAAPAPPPPLALPAPPHSRGARVGQGRPSRVMTRAAVARGDPLFKENPSSQSRRDSVKYLVAVPKHPPASLKRTWDCLQAMRDDGTWAALTGGKAIIPLADLKGASNAEKRFENSDRYLTMCKNARARMTQFGLLKDGKAGDEHVGPRCTCGARMVVTLSDTVQYWVDGAASGTAPYFTSTEAGAADAARRGWTRILPRYHDAAPPAAAASAGGAREKVYREEGIEGVFSDYLPGSATADRAALVAAVEDGYVNPATGARHAPLRLWTVGRRKLAWQAARLEGRALTTTRNRFNALLAMYWALTHLNDVQLGEDAPAKKLEEAGGKMLTASGKNRYEAVSEYAASVVHARATAGT